MNNQLCTGRDYIVGHRRPTTPHGYCWKRRGRVQGRITDGAIVARLCLVAMRMSQPNGDPKLKTGNVVQFNALVNPLTIELRWQNDGTKTILYACPFRLMVEWGRVAFIA